MTLDFSKKSLIFITGASKGIGRAIAVEISRNLHQHSILVLLARSQQGLDHTKTVIAEVDKSLTVLTYTTDLSKPNTVQFEEIFESVVQTADTNDIKFSIIFHNAGHIGEVKRTTDLVNLDQWRQYYDLNVFSVALLNSVFIKKIRPFAPQLVTINITSICGRVPYENLGQYGSGKAAREILFKVLALEEPKIIVLNYSPGPVDTDMFDTIVSTAQSNNVKKNFKEVKEKSILTPEQTVGKLLHILEKKDFKSGDTIDYFERI